ncbi:MAG: ATP-binding cassette domain-containing protein [Candidatus Protistobacter heckmanni]|nr:ATP-binding cassette domain-containing protein [Candidatus Protistobacter heckmanni]
MNTTGNVIDLANVGQVFTSSDGSKVTALQNVNLSLRRHEFVSVIGPSGCGKSTILRLIAGLLLPSFVQVSIFDIPVSEPRDEIGMVFQHPTLLPWLTVLDNITFPMKHKYGRVDAKETARAHARRDELRAAANLERAVQYRGLRAQFDPGSPAALRPNRGDERAARPHERNHRHAPGAPLHPGDAVRPGVQPNGQRDPPQGFLAQAGLRRRTCTPSSKSPTASPP